MPWPSSSSEWGKEKNRKKDSLQSCYLWQVAVIELWKTDGPFYCADRDFNTLHCSKVSHHVFIWWQNVRKPYFPMCSLDIVKFKIISISIRRFFYCLVLMKKDQNLLLKDPGPNIKSNYVWPWFNSIMPFRVDFE